MKISLMWMTRKRSHELIYSLSSFIINANQNKEIEYIIVIDPDDKESEEALKKVSKMSCVHDAKIFYLISDQHYGYGELEQYQNLVGKIFTGECLIITGDDVVCIDKGWDDEIRKSLEPVKNKPSFLLPSITFLGVNRKWHELTGRISGSRATDSYLMDLGKALNIEPLKPKVGIAHLQRGRASIEYVKDGKKQITAGLPDDGAGGYPTKKPIPPKYYHKRFPNGDHTDFIEGSRRFNEDLNKLKKHLHNENT